MLTSEHVSSTQVDHHNQYQYDSHNEDKYPYNQGNNNLQEEYRDIFSLHSSCEKSIQIIQYLLP